VLLFDREIGEMRMTLRHVIWFRIFLYISVLLTAFFVNTMVGLGRLSYIFIGLGGPFLLLPMFVVSPWYLRSFRKTKFGFLSFPPLAIIPCWYLIQDRFVKLVTSKKPIPTHKDSSGKTCRQLALAIEHCSIIN
tara:strand:- start:351 stop:752 length:402 start_codon:yes stop_codon:yes gene_type:complete